MNATSEFVPEGSTLPGRQVPAVSKFIVNECSAIAVRLIGGLRRGSCTGTQGLSIGRIHVFYIQINCRLHRLPLLVCFTHFYNRIAKSYFCMIDKTLVRLMPVDDLRPKSVLQKVDELWRPDGMEVNRHIMKILNRSWIKRFCDIPLVTPDVLNRSDAFAVFLVRRLRYRSCAGCNSAGIDFVNIRNVQVNRTGSRIHSWPADNQDG